jgi:acetoin utilization protein AcuC
LKVLDPEPIDEGLLAKIHDERYIELVRRLSVKGSGYLSLDTPVFPGIFEWSLLYCGASLLAAEKASSGLTVFNPCGGLHHARFSSGGGFCVFNDVALAALSLFERGFRVAVVDWDAHAGDGTMDILYHVPILKISIHEDPIYLYPGDGFVSQFGEGEGYGYTINIPLEPFSSDREFLFAFRQVVIPALRKFNPDVIILQSGADGHFSDPLTHLNYTVAGYREAAYELRKFGKPVAMLGGGGYDVHSLPIIWGTVYSTLIGLFESVVGDYEKLASVKVKSDDDVFKVVEGTIDRILNQHPFFNEV